MNETNNKVDTPDVSKSNKVDAMFTEVMSLVNANAKSFVKVKFEGNLMSKDFVDTCKALSNAGRYDTTITVDGVAYPLSDYKVDTKLKALIQPKAVVMPGDTFYWKDLRVHGISISKILSPAEYMEKQYAILSKFKVTPNFVDVTNVIEKEAVTDVSVFMNKAGKVHCDNLNSLTCLPVMLTISEDMFEGGYYDFSMKTALLPFVINMLSSLSSHN